MAGARLAVKVVVSLSFCRDFHPAALRQLAWRTKIVHNFCRTFFQTPSGFGGQPRQSADRRPFAGNLFQDICALTSGQAAEKHHGKLGCDRCQTTFGQSDHYFFLGQCFRLPRSQNDKATGRTQPGHKLSSHDQLWERLFCKNLLQRPKTALDLRCLQKFAPIANDTWQCWHF